MYASIYVCMYVYICTYTDRYIHIHIHIQYIDYHLNLASFKVDGSMELLNMYV